MDGEWLTADPRGDGNEATEELRDLSVDLRDRDGAGVMLGYRGLALASPDDLTAMKLSEALEAGRADFPSSDPLLAWIDLQLGILDRLARVDFRTDELDPGALRAFEDARARVQALVGVPDLGTAPAELDALLARLIWSVRASDPTAVRDVAGSPSRTDCV